MRDHLRSGRLRRAVAEYRGPVLPQSSAPGVTVLRNELHMMLRSALLAEGDADALLSFADTGYGYEDYDIWSAARDALPATSPR